MVAICGYGRKSEIYKAGYQDKLIASLRHRFELFSTGRISSSLEPFSSVGRGESGNWRSGGWRGCGRNALYDRRINKKRKKLLKGKQN